MNTPLRTSWILVLALLILSCNSLNKPSNGSETTSQDIDSVLPLPDPGVYGIPEDSFYVETLKVRRNQTFAEIMYHIGLAPEAINTLQQPDSLFNPARLRYGNTQLIYRKKNDSLPAYWVYQSDPVHWHRFELNPPYSRTHGQKPVLKQIRKIHGEIHSSLWNAAADMNFPFELALQLADMYAWTIDFFDLKSGDHFDVLYEEEFVDTLFSGITRIFGARFVHEGKEIWAIPFVQDSTPDYFDQDGNSLKRTFLKAPLRFRRISSRFSYSRLHPILKIRRPHLGVDYAAPVGTPVHSVGDGKVSSMKHTKGSGKMVKIRHNSIYTTAYLHLSRYAKGLYVGKQVRQGDVIGYVGSTGLSTGPHLDFRFYKNGTPIDPLKIKSPPVTPIKEEYRAQFDSVKTVLFRLINPVE